MQKTILIVEDESNLRNALKKILTANNFKVTEAADGAQALELIEQSLPDLVLLDFGLPKVSGETVCVKIKKDHPSIIVIALTEISDVVHALQIGADDYMSKPYVAEELIARIDARFKIVPNPEPAKSETIDPKMNTPPLESTTVLDANIESRVEKMVFRESIVLIVVRLIITELIFGITLFLFSFLTPYLNTYLNLIGFSAIYFIVLVGSFLWNIIIVSIIALKWDTEFTEVSKGGIVEHSGILHKKEQKYSCNFVEAIKVEQSLLGLIFDYGTIELYDPALKERVFLLNIASPKKYSKLIEQVISREDTTAKPFIATE